MTSSSLDDDGDLELNARGWRSAHHQSLQTGTFLFVLVNFVALNVATLCIKRHPEIILVAVSYPSFDGIHIAHTEFPNRA